MQHGYFLMRDKEKEEMTQEVAVAAGIYSVTKKELNAAKRCNPPDRGKGGRRPSRKGGTRGRKTDVIRRSKVMVAGGRIPHCPPPERKR